MRTARTASAAAAANQKQTNPASAAPEASRPRWVVSTERFRLVCLHRSQHCATCRAYMDSLQAENDGFAANELERVSIECPAAPAGRGLDASTPDQSEVLCRALDLPALLIPMWRAYLLSCEDGNGSAGACAPRIFLVTPERTLFECTGNGGMPRPASIFAATASLRGARDPLAALPATHAGAEAPTGLAGPAQRH